MYQYVFETFIGQLSPLASNYEAACSKLAGWGVTSANSKLISTTDPRAQDKVVTKVVSPSK